MLFGVLIFMTRTLISLEIFIPWISIGFLFCREPHAPGGYARVKASFGDIRASLRPARASLPGPAATPAPGRPAAAPAAAPAPAGMSKLALRAIGSALNLGSQDRLMVATREELLQQIENSTEAHRRSLLAGVVDLT